MNKKQWYKWRLAYRVLANVDRGIPYGSRLAAMGDRYPALRYVHWGDYKDTPHPLVHFWTHFFPNVTDAESKAARLAFMHRLISNRLKGELYMTPRRPIDWY